MALETDNIFNDLYQRVWIDQESPFDEYDGIRYIKSFKGLPSYIIVRDEYNTIWEFIKGAYQERALERDINVSGGLLVTGQPGIGKTLFLVYALVKALKERIPVSYCVTEIEIIVFNTDGCNNGRPRFQMPAPERTLCLVDSGVNLTQPPDIVMVMDLWTKREKENLVLLNEKYGISTSPDPSRYTTPLELFDIIGPSPRNCFRYKSSFIKTPEGIKALWPYGDLASLLSNTSVLGHILKTGIFPPSNQVPQFHHFFFGKPRVENPQSGDPRFRYTVPTAFLESCLYDYVVTRKPRQQFRFLCALASLPQARKLVYEPYIVSHMCEITESLPCYLIGNPANSSPSFHLGPGLSLERLPLRQAQEYCDNTIYMPQSGGTPFDAFVISEKITRVTMLHFAVTQSHELEPSSIHRVIDAYDFKGKLLDLEFVRWSFLFVAPGKGGEMVAGQNMKFKLGEEDVEVRIGWISTDDEKY
ncbi:hypothetical protein AGABI1DRAFT_127423 [Agaricus bisporus var. burnettii JB137-S8]|uniref:Uncharacterized protein n=1 Tax=Agaricus bisporus var. burnettii (strain JB137-S8 / ATCC MYA-4627 / FGSC 10392) TaxID=597362 RepID=K5X9N2_AGABU|nr:uncharacterized protein AGABI1DRAFT_127423 [Agaricus bisporus var. burnettii JB137-S8]EKM79737.1 hypothetical protein AGABI1DRAFT_127423 [Agaricus bisporus var. burnettii JB137-S8]